jgi:hypothetical protein
VVEDVAPGRDTEGRAESTQRQVLTSRVDACYFSFVTITTLGYGDYVPATQLAPLIVMCGSSELEVSWSSSDFHWWARDWQPLLRKKEERFWPDLFCPSLAKR